MKKNKIIGIILIVIGLFCVFGAISVNSGAPETAKVISNAVYVSDGKVLPENEGKVVIVPGVLDSAGHHRQLPQSCFWCSHRPPDGIQPRHFP